VLFSELSIPSALPVVSLVQVYSVAASAIAVVLCIFMEPGKLDQNQIDRRRRDEAIHDEKLLVSSAHSFLFENVLL
jgi:hypothetical protein